MAFHHAHGFKLHYVVNPHKAPKTRETGGLPQPCYVLSHGLFFGNLSAWYPLFTEALSYRGDTLCYDHRGHGLSEITANGYKLEDHVNDLDTLISELGWEDRAICFIGHSYGARVGLSLAAKRHTLRSEHRDQVILIDPPLLSYDQSKDPLFKDLTIERLEEIKEALPNDLTTLFSRKGRRFKKMFKRWEQLLKETTFCQDLRALPSL